MATPNTPPTRSAFFYGTLMAPSVLHRVTNRPKSTQAQDTSKPQLTYRPAILPGFRRHRVKHADYPAIVPVIRSTAASSTTSTSNSDSESAATAKSHMSSEVRGTFVTGLVTADMRRLDAFEGSDYERQFVRVKVLPADRAVPEQATKEVQDAAAAHDESEEWAPAETYVWIDDVDNLEDREWDFDEFVREKLWMWAGGRADSGFEDAAAVDDGAFGRGSAVDPTGGRSVTGGEFEKRMAEKENDAA